ncbi:MAG: asparagine synthase-related protein [Candidatus Bathyarchaeota archaeon]|nr:asparagine synthase-related protein [Candidatus Bathyarchaeota archaeon]
MGNSENEALLANVDEVASQLRNLLEKATMKNLTRDMLFSGGIDTSILATIVAKKERIRGFTCTFKEANALDTKYAKLMAERLNIEHYMNPFGEEQVFEAIPDVVKVLNSFDPMEVRNSITINIGLRFAKKYGVTKIITGDGADELFAGYHMYYRHVGNKEKLSAMLEKMWGIMAFSAGTLGKNLGIEVVQPFLDPEVQKFAMTMDPRYNVQEERGEVWGKWILRKAFEDVLPPEVRWRDKNPIEVGSGTTILPKYLATKISDSEFAAKKKKILETDNVTIRDKEQLIYYEAYREAVGVPHAKDPDARTCPQCNSNVADNAVVCPTCGAYPIAAGGRSITNENAYADNKD